MKNDGDVFHLSQGVTCRVRQSLRLILCFMYKDREGCCLDAGTGAVRSSL